MGTYHQNQNAAEHGTLLARCEALTAERDRLAGELGTVDARLEALTDQMKQDILDHNATIEERDRLAAALRPFVAPGSSDPMDPAVIHAEALLRGLDAALKGQP
jgi:hypothetical protein